MGVALIDDRKMTIRSWFRTMAAIMADPREVRGS
jgi:hypothetical protein